MNLRATEPAGDTHWQVIHLADAAPTPWKNGGGTTRELVAWPDADQWVWRMSVAEVAQSGPFSRFDGVQRWFAVLKGAGLALTYNGTRHALTVDSAPFCFDGGASTDCELLDGPTQDFNLMTRVAGGGVEGGVAADARASAKMTRVRGRTSVGVTVSKGTIKIIAIYVISTWEKAKFDDEITVIAPHTLVWRMVTPRNDSQVEFEFEVENALLMEITMAAEPVSYALAGRPMFTATDSGSSS